MRPSNRPTTKPARTTSSARSTRQCAAPSPSADSEAVDGGRLHDVGAHVAIGHPPSAETEKITDLLTTQARDCSIVEFNDRLAAASDQETLPKVSLADLLVARHDEVVAVISALVLANHTTIDPDSGTSRPFVGQAIAVAAGGIGLVAILLFLVAGAEAWRDARLSAPTG